MSSLKHFVVQFQFLNRVQSKQGIRAQGPAGPALLDRLGVGGGGGFQLQP